MSEGAPDGLVVVDKPAGWTSHDVVARIRRLARTRRVGHAGTLDPAATGVLVVGVGRATRLLGHLALTDKAYSATIRLGVATTSDDAESAVTARADTSSLREQDVRTAIARFVGDIDQVPSSVSAVKVDGQRAYRRVRSGEPVALAPRRVSVARFEPVALRRGLDAGGHVLDVEVRVECSSGTYVRALARDLGAALGVGGHLTALRRTRVGPYGLAVARSLDSLAQGLAVLPLADSMRAAFPVRAATAEEARSLAHGRPLPAAGLGPGPVAVIDPAGAALALVEEREGLARPLVVFAAAG